MNPIYTTIALLSIAPTVVRIAPASQSPSTIYSRSSQTIIAATKLTSCGTNWDCFIKLAKTCTPAQVRGDTLFNIFGMEYTATGLYEIWGQKGDRCVLYARNESWQIQMSDEFRSLARSQGMTPQQIAEYERELTAQADRYPTSSICRFNQPNDLATYLEFITGRGNIDLGLGLGGQISFGQREVAQCSSQILK